MQSFETNENINPNPNKSDQELVKEKVNDSLLKALTARPEELQAVTIFPGSGMQSHDDINAILQNNGLKPLEVILSCGFIYKAEINLKAAEELCALPIVDSIYEDWSAQSF